MWKKIIEFLEENPWWIYFIIFVPVTIWMVYFFYEHLK
jgi:hypothetical protein